MDDAPEYAQHGHPPLLCKINNNVESNLTPTAQRIHDFKMKNSIDHIVKNIFQMGPNFIP
jgi:hypothetical protein